MAEVFIGRRRGPAGVDKRVVVKRIRAERAGDAQHLDLFIREAQISMSLAHKNLVPVFDFGRVGDRLFLAMELVEGRDLASALKRAAARGRPLDPVMVAHVGAEVCQGLDYAHKKRGEDGKVVGLVHRDVKPANVMVSFAGEVKLLDFGVARLSATQEREGALRGTLGYMAPEQARGEELDARADVFSLGLVLWEALTGKPALLRDGDDRGLLARSRSGEVPALQDALPSALREAIERATRPRREDRYPDAQAFGRALDEFVLQTRAAAPGAGGLDERLATWMHELFAGEEVAPVVDVAGGERPAAEEFVTFLDDGLESVAATAATRAGSTTPTETPGPTPPPTPAPPARGSRLGSIVLVVVALGAAGVVVQRMMSASGNRRASADAPRPDAARPDAARLAIVSPDAAVSAPIVPSDAPAQPVRIRRTRVTGILKITTTPWATVTVGGKRLCEETPCQITLPAGPASLVLANPVAGLERVVQVTVPESAELIVRESLERR